MGGFDFTEEDVSPLALVLTGGGAGGGGDDDVLSATWLKLALSRIREPSGARFSLRAPLLEAVRVGLVPLIVSLEVGRTGGAAFLRPKPSAVALDLTLRNKEGSSGSPIDGGVVTRSEVAKYKSTVGIKDTGCGRDS